MSLVVSESPLSGCAIEASHHANMEWSVVLFGVVVSLSLAASALCAFFVLGALRYRIKQGGHCRAVRSALPYHLSESVLN